MPPPPSVTVSVEARIAATYARLMTGVDPPFGINNSSSSGGGDDSVVAGGGYPTSPQMMQYWSRVIRAGKKSMRDFEASVLQSDEYALRVRERFEAAWKRVLGVDVPFDIDALPTCRSCMASIDDGVGGRPAFVPEAQVEREVRSTPQFFHKYADVVRSRAFLLRDDAAATEWQLAPADLEAFVGKFRDDPEYDTTRLEDDLRQLLTTHFRRDHHHHLHRHHEDDRTATAGEPAVASAAEEPDRRPSSRPSIIATKQEPTTNPSPDRTHRATMTVATPTPLPAVAWYDDQDGSAVRRVLREFVAVFGRPMFVQEFLRYCGRSSSSSLPPPPPSTTSASQTCAPPIPDKGAFERDLARLRRLANVVRGVHGRFTGHAVSDYEIVDEWLHLIDERGGDDRDSNGNCGDPATKTMLTPEAIEARVSDSVVRSEMYERAMRSKIEETQRESRGGVGATAITAAGGGGGGGGGAGGQEKEGASYDVDCLFEVARQRRLDLVGEELREAVRAYDAQSARLRDFVTNVYATVLDRLPDAEELRTTVRSYRERLKSAAREEQRRLYHHHHHHGRHTSLRSSSSTTVYHGGVGVFMRWQGSMEDEQGGGSGGGVDDEEEARAEQPIVSELNEGLECRLVADLEFHDVLKRRISRTWENAHRCRLRPPVVAAADGGYGTCTRSLVDHSDSGDSNGDYLLAPAPPPPAVPPPHCSASSSSSWPSPSSAASDVADRTATTTEVPVLSGRLLYDTLRAVLKELERAPYVAVGVDNGKPANFATALCAADRVASERFASIVNNDDDSSRA